LAILKGDGKRDGRRRSRSGEAHVGADDRQNSIPSRIESFDGEIPGAEPPQLGAPRCMAMLLKRAALQIALQLSLI
jgi:hypothetical protein